MSIERASAVADEVLFGTDARHPHGAARKRDGWRFGVLAPLGASSDHLSHSLTECVVEAEAGAVLHLRVRFVRGYPRPPASGGGPGAPAAAPDEGVLQEVDAALPVDGPPRGREVSFTVPAATGGGHHADERVNGLVTVTSTPLDMPGGLVRVGVHVANRTRWCATATVTRERVSRCSMAAAHTVLRIDRGAFVPPLDPPEWAAPAVVACRNEHVWPVLVGGPGERDLLLSSPIVLGDYPEAAPGGPRDAAGVVEAAPPPSRPGAGRAATPGHAPAAPPAVRAVTGADGIPAETLERVGGALRHLDDATGWAATPEG